MLKEKETKKYHPLQNGDIILRRENKKKWIVISLLSILQYFFMKIIKNR
jgi:hypothetical protein